MSAFEPETVEICRSLGMVLANLSRPVSLFEIWQECANSRHWPAAREQTFLISLLEIGPVIPDRRRPT
jgi:hypothetical protein